MRIDFHTHTFPEKVSAKAIASLAASGGTKPYSDGSLNGLAASMRHAGIDLSLSLPVATRADQVERINRQLLETKAEAAMQGILFFGAMHPDCTHWHDELHFLHQNGFPGIKLHPAFQGADLDDIRYLHIIEEASSLGLIVLTHAGEDVSFPGQNHASIGMILNVLREIRPDKLVAAHMGGWNAWDRVGSELAGSPVWLDTAFSIGRVDQPDGSFRLNNLDTDAFVHLARRHGTDRILFATDLPWGDQSAYLDMICSMPFTPEERDAILGGNAERLLGKHTDCI